MLLITSMPLSAQERLLQPDDLTARATAASVLRAGLDDFRAGDAAPGGARLAAALNKARALLPEGSAARAALDRILQRRVGPEQLAPSITELCEDLTFRPVLEAGMPEGVPGFRALDELELRSYPAYRMVRAAMKGNSTAAFWPLFQHIKSHSIAMTTPVQIDYRSDGDDRRQASMAFLYGSTALGTPGRDGKVEVVDVPATTVISIGSRGPATPTRIAELHERVKAWIAQSPEWESAGPLRVMEYNSPFLTGDRRYFEVQVPVRARGATGTGAGTGS